MTAVTDVTLLRDIARGRALVRLMLVREMREACGLSQSELAGGIGVTVASVSRWEHRDRVPRGRAAAALARVLSECYALATATDMSAVVRGLSAPARVRAPRPGRTRAAVVAKAEAVEAAFWFPREFPPEEWPDGWWSEDKLSRYQACVQRIADAFAGHRVVGIPGSLALRVLA